MSYALGAIALWGLLAALALKLAAVPPFLLTGIALVIGALVGGRALAHRPPPPAALALGVYGLFGFHFFGMSFYGVNYFAFFGIPAAALALYGVTASFKEDGITGGVFDPGVTDVFIHPMPKAVLAASEKKALRAVFLKWQAQVRNTYYR